MLEVTSFSEGGKSRLFCLDVLVSGTEHREPTSGLEPLTCSLRVCGKWLLSVAQPCNSRLGKGVSVPCLAWDCRVLHPG
jgi:hypothetical protein